MANSLVLLLLLVVAVRGQFPPFIEECVHADYPPTGRPKVPTYTVNLDLPPGDRWNLVAKEKAPEISHLVQTILSFIKDIAPKYSKELIGFIDHDMSYLADTLPAPYAQEIKGMATATGINLGEIVLYNVFYEVFSMCTSIVAQDPTGKLYHARNLDFGLFMGWNANNHTWKLTEALRPAIVNLDFQRGGKTVYKTVNFAGYIGVFTGVKPGLFTVTMNERFSLNGGYIGIIEWVLGQRNSSWIGFLTRDVLEKAQSYSQAKDLLSRTPTLAPAYYILGGNKAGEACIITRARSKALDVWDLGTRNSTWYLLETNYDNWKAPLFLDNRRAPAHKCMDKITQKNVGFSGIFDVLSSRPMRNKLTTYTALMQVDTGRVETYLQFCPDPCPPF